MSPLLNAAFQYREMGFSIIPVDAYKKSIPYWKPYQHHIITEYELNKQFQHPAIAGIAIVCGQISGGLEGIDIDSKYEIGGSLIEQFFDRIEPIHPQLIPSFVVASTKNKGFHLLYRSIDPGTSGPLARRPCTPKELQTNPQVKIKALIEIRANGGYLVVPPTPGYQFIQHDLNDLSFIEPEHRLQLLQVARSFNQVTQWEQLKKVPARYTIDTDSPLDEYDQRGDVLELLQRHGWTIVRTTPEQTFLRRPGNTDHDTSGDFHHVKRLFGVFTTSTDFNAREGYRPHAVYAILECNGNFKRAAKELLLQGYGVPYRQRQWLP